MNPKKLLKNLAVAAVTLALLWWAFSRIDFTEFMSAVAGINLWWFFASMSLMVPQVLLYSWRLKLFLSKDYEGARLWDMIKISLSCGSLNLFVPSKAGDIIGKMYIFKKYNMLSLSKSAGLVVLEKALDVFAISVITLAGLAIVWKSSDALIIAALIAGAIVLAVAAALAIRLDKFFKKEGGKIKKILSDVYAYYDGIRSDKILLSKIVLLSFVSWSLQLTEFLFLFFAFGEFLNPIYIFALVPTALIISMAPITISGWGLRENSMVALFGVYGFSAATVLAVSLLSSFRYFLPGIIGILFFYMFVRDKNSVPLDKQIREETKKQDLEGGQEKAQAQ